MQGNKNVYLDANKVPDYIWADIGDSLIDMVMRLKTDPATKDKFEELDAEIRKERAAKC